MSHTFTKAELEADQLYGMNDEFVDTLMNVVCKLQVARMTNNEILTLLRNELALRTAPVATKFNIARHERYQSASAHWLKVGYTHETARALAAAKHGVDDDVKIWGLGIMKAKTNLREEDLL